MLSESTKDPNVGMGFASRGQAPGALIADGNYQSSGRRLGADRAGKGTQFATVGAETTLIRSKGYTGGMEPLWSGRSQTPTVAITPVETSLRVQSGTTIIYLESTDCSSV